MSGAIALGLSKVTLHAGTQDGLVKSGGWGVSIGDLQQLHDDSHRGDSRSPSPGPSAGELYVPLPRSCDTIGPSPYSGVSGCRAVSVDPPLKCSVLAHSWRTLRYGCVGLGSSESWPSRRLSGSIGSEAGVKFSISGEPGFARQEQRSGPQWPAGAGKGHCSGRDAAVDVEASCASATGHTWPQLALRARRQARCPGKGI